MVPTVTWRRRAEVSRLLAVTGGYLDVHGEPAEDECREYEVVDEVEEVALPEEGCLFHRLGQRLLVPETTAHIMVHVIAMCDDEGPEVIAMCDDEGPEVKMLSQDVKMSSEVCSGIVL